MRLRAICLRASDDMLYDDADIISRHFSMRDAHKMRVYYAADTRVYGFDVARRCWCWDVCYVERDDDDYCLFARLLRWVVMMRVAVIIIDGSITFAVIVIPSLSLSLTYSSTLITIDYSLIIVAAFERWGLYAMAEAAARLIARHERRAWVPLMPDAVVTYIDTLITPRHYYYWFIFFAYAFIITYSICYYFR